MNDLPENGGDQGKALICTSIFIDVPQNIIGDSE